MGSVVEMGKKVVALTPGEGEPEHTGKLSSAAITVEGTGLGPSWCCCDLESVSEFLLQSWLSDFVLKAPEPYLFYCTS